MTIQISEPLKDFRRNIIRTAHPLHAFTSLHEFHPTLF